MSKDLTISQIDRQNILHSHYALPALELAVSARFGKEADFLTKTTLFCHEFCGSEISSNKPLTKSARLSHTVFIKPAAPLLACVIRWVFFCPDPMTQKTGGVF